MTKTERNDSMLRGETMLAIWKAAVEEIRQGRDFVLVTILDVRGSSPRHTGTRMSRGRGLSLRLFIARTR